MTTTATMPAVAFTAAPTLDADEVAGLPTWLYRSEAFAEDLQGGDELPAPLAGGRRPVPGLLYGATLAGALIAVITLWPAAGLVA